MNPKRPRNSTTSSTPGAARSCAKAVTGPSCPPGSGHVDTCLYDGTVLVWMDLEMTGLDHTSEVIVEIATIVTDDDLTIVAEGPDLVIHQPDEVLAKMDPFVLDMHTRSGLLDAI